MTDSQNLHFINIQRDIKEIQEDHSKDGCEVETGLSIIPRGQKK
jgi:hypothetical protein